MVFLSKDSITSLIFGSRFSILLWGFKLTLNSETPKVIRSKRLQSGELGGQFSFSHTSGKALLDPILRPLIVVGRGTVLLEDVMAISSYLVHPPTPFFSSLFWNVHLLLQGPHEPAGVSGDELLQVVGQDSHLVLVILEVGKHIRMYSKSDKSILLPLNIINSVLLDVSVAHNLLPSPSGVKSGDSSSFWRSLLIHLCRNVSVYCYILFGKQLRWFAAKEWIEKMIF